MTKYKTIIGRAELMNLPEVFLENIPVKIDTGAFLSSIHATDIKVVKRAGKSILTYNLLGSHPATVYDRQMESSKYELTTIENSFGDKEERYKVTIKVKIAGKSFSTVFTLADRSSKAFPVLIGRKMLNNRFIVDTSITHVDRRVLKEKVLTLLAKDDNSEEEINS